MTEVQSSQSDVQEAPVIDPASQPVVPDPVDQEMEDVLKSIRGEMIKGDPVSVEGSPQEEQISVSAELSNDQNATPVENSSEVGAENEPVLDLSEVINEDGSITDLKSSGESEDKRDVLDQIDQALEAGAVAGEGESAEPAQAPEASVQNVTEPVEGAAMEQVAVETPPQEAAQPVAEQAVAPEVAAPVAEVAVEQQAVPQEAPPMDPAPQVAAGAVEPILEAMPPEQIQLQPVVEAPVAEQQPMDTLQQMPEAPVQAPILPEQAVETSMLESEELFSGEETLENTKAQLERLVEAAAAVQQKHTPGFCSGLTVEMLVLELLRPELKKWLNKHLPRMVQTIVQSEIKKLLPEKKDP